MRYFNLFSNILITKGVTRILISDLQRNISELYPLELYSIIAELKTNSIEDIVSIYDHESQKIFQKYLDILLEKEYGFISKNDWDKNFPPLSYDHHDYSVLTNIFIELEEIAALHKVKHSIETLGIRHLVIYSGRGLSLDQLLEIDEIFKTSSLEGIEIYSLFHNSIDKNFIHTLNKNTTRIYNLVFHHCDKTPFKVKDEYRFALTFTDQEIKLSSCGKVSIEYFNTHLTKVLEAVNYNSCLYKKIGIDREGNIRNCPCMPQSFGNIRNTTLEEVLNHQDFKKYWNLTKDHIETCKDCEFRYICTDCRAFTERSHISREGLDISRPLKCGYDPYTGKWEEWSTHPLKQKAMQYYKTLS